MEELRNSQTYIDMYAKYIKTGKDKEIRAFLKSHEKEFRASGGGEHHYHALTENAENGQIPVPEFVYDTVKTAWEDSELLRYVRKLYVKGNLKVGFEVFATGAFEHLEGDEPIPEEQLAIGVVELVPSMVKKYVMLSDELEALASREFLMYVYDELTHQIALKLEREIIESIVNQPVGVNVPEVVNYGTNPKPETIAMSLSKLCAEAKNPVAIMNRGTWGEFKKAQYEANYPIDVFEKLTVIFSDVLSPFANADVNEPYLIVGDFENGFLMNYPEGDEIRIKRDDITLATQDLVRYVGRVYCALGVIAPRHFVAVTKASEGGSGGGGDGVAFKHKTFKIVPEVRTSQDFSGDIVCDISTGTISRVTISEEYGNLAPIDLGVEQNNGEISIFGTPQPNDMCYAVSEGPQGYMFALIAEFEQQYQVLVTGTNCTVQVIGVNNFGIAIPTDSTETAILTVTIKDGES